MWLTLEGPARACAGSVARVPEIFGTCDERFAPVRDALADNFRSHDELGAAVAIALDGEPVVDIWAGWKDSARTRLWERDTLVPVFSVGKAMAALCVLLLVERGEVDLDAPVARYWPEFAAAGKGEVTIRTLLSHRAGLPAIRRALPDEATYDWDLMAGALAAEEPWWEPGSTHGYHVNTLGFLAGEIVRRVGGASIGAFFRTEVAEPLGADFHFGFGAEETTASRSTPSALASARSRRIRRPAPAASSGSSSWTVCTSTRPACRASAP
jgi:CubicO group peptidase (beta-lactamase class C family)